MTTKSPSNPETEARMLGASLNSYDWASKTVERLTGLHFVDPRTRLIFDLIDYRVKNDLEVDSKIIFDLTKDKGVTASFISGILMISNSGLDQDEMISELDDLYKLRRLQELTRTATDSIALPNTNLQDFTEGFEKKYFEIVDQSSSGSIHTITELLTKPEEFTSKIQKRQDKYLSGEFSYDGLPTHFRDLDSAISGLVNGHLVICGARPGVGKTSFALNLIENICLKSKGKCIFFSLEMPKDEIVEKLIAQSARIHFRKLKEGNISGKEYQDIYAKSMEWKGKELIIDDQASITIDQLYSRSVRAKRSVGIDCVLIDYVQLLRSPKDKENRHLEIGAISRKLKEIAKSLNIPVVALAQLNREVEKRADKRPLLSDLRESGSLEADADAVILLHRPDMYDKHERAGLVDFIIAKNRFGPVCKFELCFNKETGVMSTYDFPNPKSQTMHSVSSEQEDRFADFSPN